MSYDLHLERFADGAAESTDFRPLWALVEPHVVAEEEEHEFVRIETEAGGAELYGLTSSTGQASSLMISRHEEGTYDLIVELARAGGMAVLLPDGPVVITDESHRDDLPADLVANSPVRIAADGETLRKLVLEVE